MGGTADARRLHFVVQKHQASHLHYDFRLEVRGVLKSWAVPKGPSLDPAIKRLAMLVEDHPYDYKDFEGLIPVGNYGAGTVIIWDHGNYKPVEPGRNKVENEKILLKQFYSGKMKFELSGKKLKGIFTLIKVPERGETGWLLSKVKDKYASKSDIIELDKSVVSGKTIEEMEVNRSARKWHSNRNADGTLKKNTPKTKKEPEKQKTERVGKRIQEEKKATKSASGRESNWAVLEAVTHTSQADFNIEGCVIKLTDVEMELWKGIPKAKLLEYYHSVSKYILPHLRDRPLSLHVKNKGPFAPGFYIKDMEGHQPECAKVYTDIRRHPKPGKKTKIDYLVCNNEATLLYMINLGCIDVNPWMSRVSKIEEPDFINIDLDPSDEKFGKAIEVANAAKEVLDEHRLKGFPKTSGKTGLHIYIPVSGVGFAQGRSYSEILGREIQKKVPGIATLSVGISTRGTKLFIDSSQNDYADTLAAAYCVRPNKIPTVSTPLEWKEINNSLDPAAFNIDTILLRLSRKKDLFLGTLDLKIAAKNSACLTKLG